MTNYRSIWRCGALRTAAVVALAATWIACTPSSQSAGAVESVAPQTVLDMQQSQDVLILDVRSPGEFASGHVPGAVNVPHEQVGARLDELATYRERPVVVYCESGRRAAAAQEVLVDAGFTRVLDLTGHMRAWRNSDLECSGCG